MTLRSVAATLLGLGIMAAPAFAAQPARPGTVNYIEGAAYVDEQPVTAKQIGSIDLEAGQEISTGPAGKAEVLLTPGVFLRLGSNSAAKMISPALELTQVALEQGEAGVEVDEIHSDNNLQVVDSGIATRLKKTGYYEFKANQPQVDVFSGKADVLLDQSKGKEVKGGHEFLFADSQSAAKEKPARLGDTAEDDLYHWSKLRSQYLAEANNQMAPEYAGYYPGWYWDPYLYGYTFIGEGPFFSPFGWGFYPAGWGGWYGGGWGWYGRAPYRHHYEGFTSHPGTTFRGTGGFHGGARR